MTVVITYCPDTAALVAEVAAKCPDQLITDEHTGNQSVGYFDRYPLVRAPGGATLSVVRHLPAELASLDNLAVIGTVERDAQGSPYRVMGYGTLSEADAAALYDSVYPRTPYTVTDETGPREVTPADLFGAMA